MPVADVDVSHGRLDVGVPGESLYHRHRYAFFDEPRNVAVTETMKRQPIGQPGQAAELLKTLREVGSIQLVAAAAGEDKGAIILAGAFCTEPLEDIPGSASNRHQAFMP